MAISAAMVKELRERTGSGLMECKKALQETNGDIDAAIEVMRKAGLAKAGKKSDRTAAEGRIIIRVSDDGKRGAIVEVNCETDFVGKGDDFIEFATQVSERALLTQPETLEALMELPLREGSDTTIETARKELIAKIGENINIRRFALKQITEGVLGVYSHGDRIGVLVEMIGGDELLAKDIAMHIAASNPQAISAQDVPTAVIESEKSVFAAQAAESGKPEEIIAKMVEGRVRKFLAEITLLGQPFVKDPDTTVEKLLQSASASVKDFTRYEVGEGIEKKEENFAEEVMAQVKGA